MNQEIDMVSIVIPTYNRSDHLRALTEMIEAQTYRPLELIVVDDGSDDDTMNELYASRGHLEEAGIKTCFCSIPHRGQDAAMSEGLKHVSGDYFFWCDDDDYLTPDAISSKVEWLTRHPEFGFVRCNAQLEEEGTGKLLGYAYHDESMKCSDILKNLLDDKMPCLAGTYLMRTSLLDKVNPQRTIPLNGEGQNLQLLIPAAMASKCGFIDKVQMHYIIHPDSHSSKGRSLTALLSRNERFRELKLTLIGQKEGELADIVNRTHDLCRWKILKSAATKARDGQ